MNTLHQELQTLLNAEAQKANTHSILLALQSGDACLDFRGSIGAPPDASFFIASVTKMFTATLILQLKDQGLIDLDMTVQNILGTVDLSDIHTVRGHAYGTQITVRQLLCHATGLADYYEGHMSLALKQGKDRHFDLNDVIQMAKSLPPQAVPDSGRSHYSDTNYQLLGAIVETVTGQSFAQAVQTRICAPLGIQNTGNHQPDVQKAPVPLAIYNRDRPLHLPLTLSSMGPDGGIVSTLNDMLVFLRAYMTSTLFEPQNTVDVRNFHNMYFPIQYGFGLMRFKLPLWMTLFRGSPELIGHSGASGSFAFYGPKEDIFLVGAFNQVDAPKRPFGFMMQVMQVLKQHKAFQ